MNTTLKVVGTVLMLMGVTWFLQGINILPGSFMTGQIKWAYYGGATAIVGIAFMAAASRRRPGSSRH